jgi:tetratricopeptide (TPR) repeat protein
MRATSIRSTAIASGLLALPLCGPARAAATDAAAEGFSDRVAPETERARRARVHWEEGRVLAAQGREAEAAAAFARSLEIDSEAVPALQGLAWIQATSADAARRRPAEAILLAERLVTLTHYRQRASTVGRNWPKAFKVTASHTLAAAFASAGRFEEAVGYATQGFEAATRLHEVAPSDETEELVMDSRWYLDLYRRGQPYHERPRACGAPRPGGR